MVFFATVFFAVVFLTVTFFTVLLAADFLAVVFLVATFFVVFLDLAIFYEKTNIVFGYDMTKNIVNKDKRNNVTLASILIILLHQIMIECSNEKHKVNR